MRQAGYQNAAPGDAQRVGFRRGSLEDRRRSKRSTEFAQKARRAGAWGGRRHAVESDPSFISKAT
jgi:hypothetical protein